MSQRLSAAQVAAYARDGFVCPVPVLSTPDRVQHQQALAAFRALQDAGFATATPA